VAQAKADIQSELDVQMAKADAEIAAQTAESEKAIADIQAGATDAVKAVAKDTAKEIIAAFGGKADAKAVTAAVTAQMKG
jgi:F-type H+-transporting ATPase subunit b